MNIDYNELFHILTQGVARLAKESLPDYFKDAVYDGDSIILDLKTSIADWTQLLVNEEIDAANFGSLINGEKELLNMKALARAGLTDFDTQQFKDDVFNLITSTVTGLVNQS